MEDTLTEIEQHLAWEASRRGLLVLKLTGEAGWPPWLVLGAANAHGFISLVPFGAKPTSIQSQRVDSLLKLGHLAVCTDSKAGVDAFIRKFEMTRVSQWQTPEGEA